jgi:hypothetical protein
LQAEGSQVWRPLWAIQQFQGQHGKYSETPAQKKKKKDQSLKHYSETQKNHRRKIRVNL